MQDGLVFELVLGLELSLVKGKSGEGRGFALGDHHCEFELGHKGSGLLGQHGVGHEKFVLQAFLDADSGGDGVFEGVESEAEGGVVVEHFVEELSALFDFQVVGPVHGSFVDGASGVQFFGFAFPARNEDVECDHVVDGEFLGVDSLLEGFFVEDDLVAINEVLLEFVGKDAFEGGDLVGV